MVSQADATSSASQHQWFALNPINLLRKISHVFLPSRVTLNAQLLLFTRDARCLAKTSCLFEASRLTARFLHIVSSYNTRLIPTKALQTVGAGACGLAGRRKENISTFRQWKRYKRCFDGLVVPKAINYDTKPLMRIWRKMGKTKQCKANGKLVNYEDVVVQGNGTEVRKSAFRVFMPRRNSTSC